MDDLTPEMLLEKLRPFLSGLITAPECVYVRPHFDEDAQPFDASLELAIPEADSTELVNLSDTNTAGDFWRGAFLLAVGEIERLKFRRQHAGDPLCGFKVGQKVTPIQAAPGRPAPVYVVVSAAIESGVLVVSVPTPAGGRVNMLAQAMTLMPYEQGCGEGD